MTDLSGWIEESWHVFPLRVYHEDTDAGGIVYYANYLKFAERARSEMLRRVGVKQSDMFRRYGMSFAVRDCSLECRRPARLDDLLEVRSRLTDLGAATLRAEQVIGREGTDVARLGLRIACVTADGRPTRIPAPLREALKPYC